MRGKLILLLILLPALAWAVFGSLGDRLSSSVASRFGPRILAATGGKVSNARSFVKDCLQDSALLLTAACLLTLAHRCLAVPASRRFPTPTRWVVEGWSVFLGLNIFAGIAAHTLLFWCLLYTGTESVQNYTQWRIKQSLMKEADAPRQAVLLGASQTWAQIDAGVLNERLGRRIWTTDLSFPGSSFYEMALCLERLPHVPVAYVITYVSEANFYTGGDNGRLLYFFGLRDLPAYWALGPDKPRCDQFLLCGLLGDVFPLYRVWDPFITRLRVGRVLTQPHQARTNLPSKTALAARALQLAKSYGFGPACSFNQRTFTTFARMCRDRGCRLVVCCGQLNPIFERALNPALRPDMLAFLRDQARRDSNIVLLEESQLLPQNEDDYDDLTHVSFAARTRSSQHIADALEALACKPSP